MNNIARIAIAAALAAPIALAVPAQAGSGKQGQTAQTGQTSQVGGLSSKPKDPSKKIIKKTYYPNGKLKSKTICTGAGQQHCD